MHELDFVSNTSLIALIARGGWVMAPLVLASLVALSVIIERLFWGPTLARVAPYQTVSELKTLIVERRFEEMQLLCRRDGSPLCRIISAALAATTGPREELLSRIEVVGRREGALIQKRIAILSTIAAVGPLLGLLGTVFGMIKTFSVIGQQGLGSAPALAAGIAQALVATAAGLIVAIPAHVFYRYFLHRSQQLIMALEERVAELVNLLTAGPR